MNANEQMQLGLEPGNDIEAAFADGRLYLQVDEPRPMSRQMADFDGASLAMRTVRWIHVISNPAGGEIRGYAIADEDGILRVRRPNYTGDWPEMDAAVLARTGAKSVAGYAR